MTARTAPTHPNTDQGAAVTTSYSPTRKPPVKARVVVDDTVFPTYAGIVWTVEEHLVKNVVLAREDQPGARRMRISPIYLLDAPAPGTKAVVEVVPYEPPLHEATVVLVDGPDWRGLKGRPYVVLGMARGRRDHYRIAKLGGDKGRYYSPIPRQWLTVVDPDSIHIVLP